MRIILIVTLALLTTGWMGRATGSSTPSTGSLYRQHVDSPEFAVRQAWRALALHDADAFLNSVDLYDLVRSALDDGGRGATGDAAVTAVCEMVLQYVTRREPRTPSRQVAPHLQVAIERALGKELPEFRGMRKIRCSESQAQVELKLFWPEPKETMSVELGLKRHHGGWKIAEIRNLPAIGRFVERRWEQDPAYRQPLRRAKARHCIGNLKHLETAKATWELDTNAAPDTSPRPAELYGPDRYILRAPICPQGGSYTIGNMSTRPTCSIGTNGTPDDREDDHRLPTTR